MKWNSNGISWDKIKGNDNAWSGIKTALHRWDEMNGNDKGWSWNKMALPWVKNNERQW